LARTETSPRHTSRGDHCGGCTGASNLEQLWTHADAANKHIKREPPVRGIRTSRRRMVINAAAPCLASEQMPCVPREVHQGRRRTISHTHIDAAGPGTATSRSRWQEGRVMGSSGAMIGSLHALLKPHATEAATDCERVAPNQTGGLHRNVSNFWSESSAGKENRPPQNISSMGVAGGEESLHMNCGVRGLQQMRRHGDEMRSFNDDEYAASVRGRIKSRPY